MDENKDTSHMDGLTEVVEIGVKSVAPRGKGRLAVTFLDELPSDVAGDLAAHRFVLEGEEQVRTIHGDIVGDTIVIDEETIPATFAALGGAAGKNLRFYRLD